MSGFGQMVILGCGDDLFAMPVVRVQEILDLHPITRLPHTPPHLLGLIDVRGESVAVADLRRLLGQPVAADSPSTRIIVLWVSRPESRTMVALKCDRVIEVADLDDSSLDPVPERGMFNWDDRLIAGIGRRNGQFVTVLDLERMFQNLPTAAKVRVA
ncbi:MAG TPA: chemotaxis protein CheW [Tabrizicola sp.]|nr:chemotaxis protein CheW [Tabrizicola sp.]